ncbi:MAG: hypothetical protein WAqPseu_39160 [Shewanella algae]|uniref:hypothetical protein n=1 Tax=Shewanella algae TaxID=38313 RepID=UPI0004683C98|nr:hypothetical protein [Shewanella algae]NKZ40288.1 hypothetical protein [Shewanella algae]QHD54751.1 hypothetical protein GM320_17320 [Shewanella algae]QTE76457.1 hypothetical protein E1N14_012825 [Shewanella algae]HDS1204698.1 hypothetical protein [Shewanella algae]
MRALFLLLLPLLLCSCSSKPNIDPADFAGAIKDSFQTDIKADGLKLFTYTARLITPDSGGSYRISVQAPRTAKEMRQQLAIREARQAVFEQQLQLGLDNTLKMNQYCREGFYELSRLLQSDRGEIRGECRDGASEMDRSRFGNK